MIDIWTIDHDDDVADDDDDDDKWKNVKRFEKDLCIQAIHDGINTTSDYCMTGISISLQLFLITLHAQSTLSLSTSSWSQHSTSPSSSVQWDNGQCCHNEERLSVIHLMGLQNSALAKVLVDIWTRKDV